VTDKEDKSPHQVFVHSTDWDIQFSRGFVVDKISDGVMIDQGTQVENILDALPFKRLLQRRGVIHSEDTIKDIVKDRFCLGAGKDHVDSVEVELPGSK
jgi:hypothetical protein